MDWKTLFITFGLVFLAELGDKTQLTAFNMCAGKGACVWAVFIGSSLALICTSALAAFTGNTIARYVPAKYMVIGSSLLFIIMGVAMLVSLAWKSFMSPSA